MQLSLSYQPAPAFRHAKPAKPSFTPDAHPRFSAYISKKHAHIIGMGPVGGGSNGGLPGKILLFFGSLGLVLVFLSQCCGDQ